MLAQHHQPKEKWLPHVLGSVWLQTASLNLGRLVTDAGDEPPCVMAAATMTSCGAYFNVALMHQYSTLKSIWFPLAKPDGEGSSAEVARSFAYHQSPAKPLGPNPVVGVFPEVFAFLFVRELVSKSSISSFESLNSDTLTIKVSSTLFRLSDVGRASQSQSFCFAIDNRRY